MVEFDKAQARSVELHPIDKRKVAPDNPVEISTYSGKRTNRFLRLQNTSSSRLTFVCGAAFREPIVGVVDARDSTPAETACPPLCIKRFIVRASSNPPKSSRAAGSLEHSLFLFCAIYL
jgi:hypothetical protein